jgi:hypothetical protein
MDRQLNQLSGFEPWLWFWALTLSGGSIFFSLAYNFSYVFPDGSVVWPTTRPSLMRTPPSWKLPCCPRWRPVRH